MCDDEPASTTAAPPPPEVSDTLSICTDFDSRISALVQNLNPTAVGIVEVDKHLEEPLLNRHGDPLFW